MEGWLIVVGIIAVVWPAALDIYSGYAARANFTLQDNKIRMVAEMADKQFARLKREIADLKAEVSRLNGNHDGWHSGDD